ncbi:MAG: hypothetical protein OEZ14_04875 [Acidimicrobiia bacterium]|nr:hypothetical protein [Acidimicrobiia bacterium]MDH5519850.1 hypothetical protein [Acidimicrobiia bacterium]
MTRPKSGSRVGGGPPKQEPVGPPDLPSMRERRPFVFWMVVLAVAAMVLSSVAGFLSVIL